MPSRGGQRKRKASERAAAAAAAAQEAQEAAVAAAAARGRGRENAKAKRARLQAEKVLRAHGVEPVAAADDPHRRAARGLPARRVVGRQF